MKNNTAKRERQLTKAVEQLKKLGIYEDYIEAFKNEYKVCLFELFGGFWLEQYPELAAKVERFEKSYGGVVYAVTHEFFDFGECYSFLYVSKYAEDWKHIVTQDEKRKDIFYADAYVWNVDDDCCSEFGSIIVRAFGGGITRIG